MGKKILVILSSTAQIPGKDQALGYYLPELAHPYRVLTDAGFTHLDFITPQGGEAPLDASSVEAFKDDPVCQEFLKDAKAQELVKNTKKPGDVKASDYSAVLYPGGHAPMFDLATDHVIGQITADVYDNGGVVAAVCHGPAGLVPVKLKNGDSIVKGKNVTSFTNSEEDLVKFTELMPFPLETKLVELGANFISKGNFEENVVVDGRLITGQNPASSTGLGQAMVAALK